MNKKSREQKQVERVLLRGVSVTDQKILRKILDEMRDLDKKELKRLNVRYKNKKNRYKVLI